MLDEIKRENSFKTFMKNNTDNYSQMLKPSPFAQPRIKSLYTEEREVRMKGLAQSSSITDRVNTDESGRKWIQNNQDRMRNVPEYNGQSGDIFQMRHRLSSGKGLQMFTDEQQANGIN